MQYTLILCISIIYCFLDLFVIKRQLTLRALGIYFLIILSPIYKQSSETTVCRQCQVYHLSVVIRQRHEVRTWTWAAAEKSLSTAAELGRVALLFLKASAVTG